MSVSRNHRIMALALGTLCLLASSPAGARVDLGINIGIPGPGYAEPTYMAPQAVYAAPTYAAPVAYPAYYRNRPYFHGRRDFHRRR